MAVLVQAAPVYNTSCTVKLERRAWHTLTDAEKLAYLSAEQCLMASPATLGLSAARSRFDELQQSHAMSVDVVHNVGAFLPYHRYFIHAHETLLRTVCNYTSPHPYWDEAMDASNFVSSVLLSPTTGFGGDGVGNESCIADGPFKDYVNPVGPGSRVNDHCITRKLGACESVYASRLAGREFVDACMGRERWGEFWPCVEFGAHSAGHGGIGGEMLDLVASPGDPLFYLHHAYLDKVWWEWQSLDPGTRLTEISGSNVPQAFPVPEPFLPGGAAPLPPFPDPDECPGFPGSPPAPPGVLPWEARGAVGDAGNVTTMDHVLTVDGALPDVRVRDVMDIAGGLLCYGYV
ncbi:Di-copper centre-containing protein [Pleomassaria siparia CBS 279.74]|uniref:Di-copper centre-containing protein n=1 Tax=Pleomassaria siparia CBS 279.74 TaxID=1314801 RepID=A0A6G1KJP5_9PLEO|nr:Di-copper centre-containing protein [Pleomassaria siparia CBS 279.74]